MKAMFHRPQLSLVAVMAGFGLLAVSLLAHGQDTTTKRGRKYKAPPPTGRIEVTITKDFNGKPIENAAVVFHPMAGDKDEGNMELKTNEDGKAVIDVIPIGDTVRLQVIAKAEMAIDVRMKRPGEQYSIYKSHDPAPSTPKDAPPPASQPKPDSNPPN
jgi:hypothetical protein